LPRSGSRQERAPRCAAPGRSSPIPDGPYVGVPAGLARAGQQAKTSTLDSFVGWPEDECMTNKLDRQNQSEGDRARSRAYHLEFWPGIIAYAVILTGVLLWGNLDGESPWRFLWAVLPVIPALWIVRAVLRHVRRVDDYQRLLLLQALGGGFAVAMITSITMAFLEIAGLRVDGVGWIIYGTGMLGWIITAAVVGRR
jgi:hypothetical protein